jgi:hypothetical protein
MRGRERRSASGRRLRCSARPLHRPVESAVCSCHSTGRLTRGKSLARSRGRPKIVSLPTKARRHRPSSDHAHATALKAPQGRGFNSTQKLMVGLPGTASGDEAAGRVDDGCPATRISQYAGYRGVHAGDLLRNSASRHRGVRRCRCRRWKSWRATCAAARDSPVRRRCWPSARPRQRQVITTPAASAAARISRQTW